MKSEICFQENKKALWYFPKIEEIYLFLENEIAVLAFPEKWMKKKIYLWKMQMNTKKKC